MISSERATFAASIFCFILLGSTDFGITDVPLSIAHLINICADEQLFLVAIAMMSGCSSNVDSLLVAKIVAAYDDPRGE